MRTKSKKRHLRKIRLKRFVDFFEMDFEDTTYILAGVCGAFITWLLCDKGIFIFDTVASKVVGCLLGTYLFMNLIYRICSFLTKEKFPRKTDNHTVGTAK